MSDVSNLLTREAPRRARLRMLRYGSHGGVFAAPEGKGAAAAPCWRPLVRERDHVWNSRSASIRTRRLGDATEFHNHYLHKLTNG